MTDKHEPMIWIYTAGSYRAGTEYEVEKNIIRAGNVGEAVIRLGDELGLPLAPLIPHYLFRRMGGIPKHDDKFFIDATMDAMRRMCDYVLVVPNSEDSTGTQGEIRDARMRGTPVFFTVRELKEHLTDK